MAGERKYTTTNLMEVSFVGKIIELFMEDFPAMALMTPEGFCCLWSSLNPETGQFNSTFSEAGFMTIPEFMGESHHYQKSLNIINQSNIKKKLKKKHINQREPKI